MDKQLNFLNIFDGEKHKKDTTDEVEKAGGLNMDADIDDKDVLENDPVEFNKFENEQREEAESLMRVDEEAGDRDEGQRKELESFLLGMRGRMDELSLSDFEPFLGELNNYHERFQSFRKQYEAAKPGLEKEIIYKKMVSPNTEDEPEWRNIAALYLIYLKKLKEFKFNNITPASRDLEKEARPKSREKSNYWKTPKLDQGKDAAAGAYLEYRDE